MLHPAWSDDSQSESMRDVIVSTQSMFDGMHGPTGRGDAERIDTVATISAGEEYICASFIILRVLNHDMHIFHQRLETCFTKTVGQIIGGRSKVLFHDMVDGISHTSDGLYQRYCKCVCRVNE